jgi:hypothetical protein
MVQTKYFPPKVLIENVTLRTKIEEMQDTFRKMQAAMESEQRNRARL